MPQVAIIVPCRLESTRFPRKLLHKIKGKPLVLWVAERIAREAPDFPLWFAVDDELLRSCVADAGYQAIMTQRTHQSGTDRLAEANRTIRADWVINVQADEPLISRGQIQMLVDLLRSGTAPMATLGTPFKHAADFGNPNQVKVVIAPANRRALYFSRAPIPFAREQGGVVDDAWVTGHPVYKHLGVYGYKASLVEQFASLPVGRLEQIEKLEQLRVLENGYEIACDVTDDPSIGVDTPEDAVRFEEQLGRR